MKRIKENIAEADERERKRKSEERLAKRQAYRTKLEAENAVLTRKFHERIVSLEDNFSPIGWDYWFKPLLYVGMDDGTVVLFHDYADIYPKGHRMAIETVIDKPVKITNGTANAD